MDADESALFAELELGFCQESLTYIGEVVKCNLPADHEGLHIGWMRDHTQARWMRDDEPR